MSTKLNCEICQDTTWIQIVKNGMPFARRCKCFMPAQVAKYIPEKYRCKWDLSGYEINYLQQCIDFLENPEAWILLLYGSTGVGKTFLTWKGIEYDGKRRGFTGINFISTRELFQILRNRIQGGFTVDENEEKYQDLISSRLIVIDELLADSSVNTPEFHSWFSQFLDALERNICKKIIITTNENPYIIKDTVPYLFSRLQERSQWILMKGKDRRLQ